MFDVDLDLDFYLLRIYTGFVVVWDTLLDKAKDILKKTHFLSM